MINTTIGILAHVDAGKTTLSESILYTTGMIRSRGRVDHKDTFLDTDSMERKRGITIYSKSARFSLGEGEDARPFTLLDTPGHADFSPEMERVLRVLDYAVLIVSAPDGVTQKVRTIWKLLSHYRVPLFIFINKADQLGKEKKEQEAGLAKVFSELQKNFGDRLVRFGEGQLCSENEEAAAVCDEKYLERYLEEGRGVSEEECAQLVRERKLVPVYAGSALQDEGTADLLEGLKRYTLPAFTKADAEKPFGAIVYKITRDSDGSRLTWLKMTGGQLSIRMSVSDDSDEKISGIRLYSGEKYEAVTKIGPGETAAVAGLSFTHAGDGLGAQHTVREELLLPIMTCSVSAQDIYGKRADNFTLLKALRALEEEEPMLHVSEEENTKEIRVQIMGEVQTQILKERLNEGFGLRAEFGPGKIVYRETIRRTVEGVGHYEPLRHYAEVHLLLTPTAPGSCISFEDACPPDTLEKNWRRLIMTHLQEKVFRGVLTGSELTDIRFTLIGGKANRKHTSGGDFRQATYRAVRQGLMMAQNILLEPVLDFHAEIPATSVGRLLTDISAMSGKADPPSFDGNTAVIEGTVPASSFGSYAQELAGYTAGEGSISTQLTAYAPCHNAREVLDADPYDPDLDRYNPSYSVFCSHGAGTPVPWNYVRQYMHVDTGWRDAEDPDASYLTDDYYTFTAQQDAAMDAFVMDRPEEEEEGTSPAREAEHLRRKKESSDFRTREAAFLAEDKELKEIFERTYGEVKPKLRHPENERYAGLSEEELDALREAERAKEKRREEKVIEKTRNAVFQEEYLLVDGYNIIFAWKDLHDLALSDIKAARDRLLDVLSNYAGFTQQVVIVVFDAYKVPGGRGSVTKYHNIDVVYTKEAETADLYIEKTAHKLSRKYRVTVATSDAVEQVIIFGTGALRLSAGGLLERIRSAEEEIRTRFL